MKYQQKNIRKCCLIIKIKNKKKYNNKNFFQQNKMKRFKLKKKD